MSRRLTADQGSGELTLHTGRAGVAARVGHDLTLRLRSWTATGELDDAGEVGSVRLVAPLASLEVVGGEGGVKPLSDKDRATILQNALGALRAQQHPVLVFEAARVRLPPPGPVVGMLSLAGATGPQAVEVSAVRGEDGLHLRVRAEVVQTAYGITPYSGMLGALKVRDAVEVRADLRVREG